MSVFYKTILTVFIVNIFSGCVGTQTSIYDDPEGSIICDTNIDKSYYEICYDYDLKGALFVSYTLDGDLVDNPNIDDRPPFYNEELLDKAYQSSYYDYIGSGYDRGHLASDASFDYSEDALYSVYSMANIVPQNPDVNRYSWIDTEYLERDKAKEYGYIDVFIKVEYSDNPQRIGENEIAVPSGFYKKIYSLDDNYEECFYYENIPYDIVDDTIQDHEISCDLI